MQKLRLILFGAGEGGRQAYQHYHAYYDIVGFCDNDPAKQGTVLFDKNVYSPAELPSLRYDRIIICSIHKRQILDQLTAGGLVDRNRIELMPHYLLPVPKLHDCSKHNLDAIRVLGLKTTFICNNRCGFCWQPHYSNKADISTKALENLKPLLSLGNLKVIQPAGGEIFLWKPIKGFLEYCTEYNKDLQMYLVTNGTLFDDYWYKKASEGFFSTISLSINAPNRELYKLISQRDNFDCVKDALARLKEIKRSCDFPVQVTFVMTRPLMGHLHEFVNLVAGVADSLLIRKWRAASSSFVEKHRFYQEHHIPNELQERVVEEIMKTDELAQSRGLLFDYTQFTADTNQEPRFSQTQCPCYDYSTVQCNHLYNQIQIENTGNVRLGCNFSSISLGNLNANNILDILSNPAVEASRRAILSERNYLSCPPKQSSPACPYAMRQLNALNGAQRYIAELPDFSMFSKQHFISRPVITSYRAAMQSVLSMISNREYESVVETGVGLMTPILATHTKSYFSDSLHENHDYLEQLESYLNHTGWKPVMSIRNRHAAMPESIDLLMVNADSDKLSVLEKCKSVRSGGYVVIHAGTVQTRNIHELICTISESADWTFCEHFGFMIFCFKKESAKNGIADGIKAYRKMYDVAARFIQLCDSGIKTIALFGTEHHTRWLQSFYYLCSTGPAISAVLDTSPDPEKKLFNMPVTDAAEFSPSSCDAIVLSTDTGQASFAQSCKELYGDSCKLIDIYHSGK